MSESDNSYRGSLTGIIFILEGMQQSIVKRQAKLKCVRRHTQLTDDWIILDENIKLLKRLRLEKDGF